MSVCLLQNVLDDRLRHANLGVVLGAVRLFQHLTDDMPHLHKDIHDRIKGESVVRSCVHVYTCTCTVHVCVNIFVLSTFIHTICVCT